MGSSSYAQEMFWLKTEGLEGLESSDWKAFEHKSLGLAFLDSLKKSSIAEGYLALNLQERYVSTDSLKVIIELGEKYFWKDILPGHVPIAFLTSGKFIKNTSYSEGNAWLQHILLEAENQGYPFAEVKLDSLTSVENGLRAIADFDIGPLIKWDSVAISGSSKTHINYIQNLTGIRPGEAFSQKKLDEASTILSRSSYFSQVNPPSLSFQLKSAKPTFFLKDRNSNVLDGVIGLLPNENESGKLLITGELDIQLYHLGGKGRDISLHWQRINIQSQTLDIKAKEAFLFNSPLDLKLGFNLLKQDSTFLNRFFEVEFGYRLSAESYLRFFTRRQAGDLISTSSYHDVTELPEVADYRWNQYGIGLNIDRRDSPFSPRRGGALTGEFAAGNKKLIQNTGIPEEVYVGLDLNTPQYLGKVSFEQHIFIRPIWGMWVNMSGGFTQNKNLLLNDLFRIGGLKSIRGFNENFFYARAYGYMNFEQRLFFGENSFLMVFADLGILENPYFAPEIDKPISFGAGVNLETGGGIFRFIYGVGKSNQQPLDFSHSRIHFGYLARF